MPLLMTDVAAGAKSVADMQHAELSLQYSPQQEYTKTEQLKTNLQQSQLGLEKDKIALSALMLDQQHTAETALLTKQYLGVDANKVKPVSQILNDIGRLSIEGGRFKTGLDALNHSAQAAVREEQAAKLKTDQDQHLLDVTYRALSTLGATSPEQMALELSTGGVPPKFIEQYISGYKAALAQDAAATAQGQTPTAVKAYKKTALDTFNSHAGKKEILAREVQAAAERKADNQYDVSMAGIDLQLEKIGAIEQAAADRADASERKVVSDEKKARLADAGKDIRDIRGRIEQLRDDSREVTKQLNALPPPPTSIFPYTPDDPNAQKREGFNKTLSEHRVDTALLYKQFNGILERNPELKTAPVPTSGAPAASPSAASSVSTGITPTQGFATQDSAKVEAYANSIEDPKERQAYINAVIEEASGRKGAFSAKAPDVNIAATAKPAQGNPPTVSSPTDPVYVALQPGDEYIRPDGRLGRKGASDAPTGTPAKGDFGDQVSRMASRTPPTVPPKSAAPQNSSGQNVGGMHDQDVATGRALKTAMATVQTKLIEAKGDAKKTSALVLEYSQLVTEFQKIQSKLKSYDITL